MASDLRRSWSVGQVVSYDREALLDEQTPPSLRISLRLKLRLRGQIMAVSKTEVTVIWETGREINYGDATRAPWQGDIRKLRLEE